MMMLTKTPLLFLSPHVVPVWPLPVCSHQGEFFLRENSSVLYLARDLFELVAIMVAPPALMRRMELAIVVPRIQLHVGRAQSMWFLMMMLVTRIMIRIALQTTMEERVA